MMSINKKRSQSQLTPVEAADALAPNDAAVASAAPMLTTRQMRNSEATPGASTESTVIKWDTQSEPHSNLRCPADLPVVRIVA